MIEYQTGVLFIIGLISGACGGIAGSLLAFLIMNGDNPDSKDDEEG